LYYNIIYEKSIKEVLEKLGIHKNQKLFFILSATFETLNSKYSENNPFFIQAMILRQYISKGVIFQKEGPKNILKSLICKI